MNIAIFTNNYLPNPYGITGSIESFRQEFEKRGHSVFIFAPKFGNYKDSNPNVFRYSSVDIKFKFRFPLAIPYSGKIDQILKNLNLDIIHAQHPNLLGTAAMKWAKKKKIPLIFTWHTLYDKYTNFIPFLPSKFSAKYIIRKAVKFANKADIVVAPTVSIISILEKWGVQKKIVPIATGVEEKYFSNADRNIIRKKYSITDDEILLLLVSRLTEEKNVEFVLRSVAKILKQMPKVKFLISGGGYLTGKLKNYVTQKKLEERIIFTGIISKKNIKNYYAAGDIFVYGSQSETQGMVVSEAMYMGLPIVAVKATGIDSLMINHSNGFLVRENEEDFAIAVQKLISDKKLREKFGKMSQKIAHSQFTSSVCADKMLRLYQEAIRNKK